MLAQLLALAGFGWLVARKPVLAIGDRVRVTNASSSLGDIGKTGTLIAIVDEKIDHKVKMDGKDYLYYFRRGSLERA